MTKRHIDTNLVHYAEKYGERGALNVPIYQNSTFKQKIPGEWEEYTYTRTNNPTEDALRKTIADLESGQFGVMFGSGLAAVNGVLELLQPGDHVVSMADIYGGSHRFFSQFAGKRGITFSYVDTSNVDEVRAAMKDSTRMVYLETPSNPLLKVSDLRALSSVSKERGALLVVDNTMATPYFQRPLELGADIVIHSTSKYLSGHTNVIGGAVVINDGDLHDKIKFIHKATGGVPGPFDCYLTMLGIKTLALRMRQHEESAIKIATFLESHRKVSKVHYPGLASHPQHALAKEQMSGFSGVLSFEIDGDESNAQRFLENLDLFSLTISFGSVASLVSYPAKMSHKEMPKEERIARGFVDSLIRLSIGVERDNDLIEAITYALEKA